MDTWSIRKNEPKTNPNEPKFKKAEMNIAYYITKGYGKKLNGDLLQNEPNTNPIYRGVASDEDGTNPISRPCPEKTVAGSSNCFYIKNLFCQWPKFSVILVH
jgi:hypothetical protein